MPTVLVIEDDTDLLYLYHTALAQKGYDVVEAHSTRQALALLEAPDFVPALVLVDMGMPDVPGTRVISFMRAEPRFDSTHIVVVTANDQYRARIAEDEITSFLVKPVTIADLIDLAKRLSPVE